MTPKSLLNLTLAATATVLPAFASEKVGKRRPVPVDQIPQINLNQVPELQLNQLNGIRRHRNVPQAGNQGAIHEPFKGPVTARKIRIAIDDAVAYLRSCQQPDGSINGNDRDTCLGTLAWLAAGGDPLSDQGLRKALDWLAKVDSTNTYVRGIRANVWEYALRKVPDDPIFTACLKQEYDWLMKGLGNKEGWRYQQNATSWDNSVTQYGVLGIWAAARGGHDPGNEFWNRMASHFLRVQNKDGGWGYQTGGSTANMATAGLATMFLVFDSYYGKTKFRQDDPRALVAGKGAKCLESIDRGMAWLGKKGGNDRDGYYLYGIERTGVASGRKYIGGRDWFKAGVDVLLPSQHSNGSFGTNGHGGSIAQTAWGTLFLVYGGAPVAINKLEYAKDQRWNRNLRDMANLSKYLWSAYERPVNWHSVSMSAAASEFEAPILFISGDSAVDFTDEQAAKLRNYVEAGGTILAEPSDHSEPFAKSMAALLDTMYPAKEYPSFGLKPLAESHKVFTVIKRNWKTSPKLSGASNGSRTFFFLSHDYMSGDWQVNDTTSDAFDLAMNLLFYVTDMGDVQRKYHSVLPDRAPAKIRNAKLTVARAIHGDGTDWNRATMTWRKMAPYLSHVAGCGIDEKAPVRLDDASLKDLRLLHLTGLKALNLTKAERTALKTFVANGGTVFVDAYNGSAEFAESARMEIAAAFGKLAPLPRDHLLATGHFAGGDDLAQSARLKLAARKALRAKGESTTGQKLEAVMVDGRPAVLFSGLDVSAAVAGETAFGALGYKPKTAYRILGNLTAYLMVD